MPYRSWLIVPGDSEKKLGKAAATGADVVVVDLADSVRVDAKAQAREMAAAWLGVLRQQTLDRRTARWVRINGLNSRMWREDLATILPGAPEGVILPQAENPEAVRQLAAELYELEQSNQIQPGSTKILPLVGQSPGSVLTIRDYPAAALPRLAGLGWDEQDLMESIGAHRTVDSRGMPTDAFRFARTQVLLAAHACGVLAIETLHPDYNDHKGLKAAARDARADGYTGMFAIHPVQVAEINATFSATEEELEAARKVVEEFEIGQLPEELAFDRRIAGTRQLVLARRVLGLDEPRERDAMRGPILRPA